MSNYELDELRNSVGYSISSAFINMIDTLKELNSKVFALECRISKLETELYLKKEQENTSITVQTMEMNNHVH